MVRLREVRSDLDRPGVGGQRRIESILRREEVAEVVVGAGQIRPARESLPAGFELLPATYPGPAGHCSC